MARKLFYSAALQLLLGAASTWSFSSPPIVSRRVTHIRPSHHQATPLFLGNNLLESLTSSLLPKSSDTTPTQNSNVAVTFLEALNQGNVDAALEFLTETSEWDECTFYERCVGKEAIERRFRLQAEAQAGMEMYSIDDMAVDQTRQTIGVLFHKEDSEGSTLPNSRGCAMFQLDGSSNNDKISKVCIVVEPATRGGEAGLKILSQANEIMTLTGYNPEAIQQQQQQQQSKSDNSNQKSPTTSSPNNLSMSPPERYFEAWNQRDMAAAVELFSDDTRYEDTAFPEPFVGKDILKEHLNKCANAFPSNFQIVVDAVAVDSSQNVNSATVEWHFENGAGEALPFTQGISFYKLDPKMQTIVLGTDFIEPAVLKPSGLALFVNSMKMKLSQQPFRWIPVASWMAYMYIVFFSDGILPGANALQLEARTWEEVLNLSLNFFLVSPLLNLPFSPSVHPMLEGVFNLLLSWAAMFAGFLSDDRPRKPNLVPMVPIVVGMQFLTSAFLLPYLALRSSEPDNDDGAAGVTKEELPLVARVAGESPLLGGLMGVVGSGSVLWFFLGRANEYGAEFSVRWTSFTELLSIDRVGSSFLVDLAIFALFQGWLVEDDLKRRGVLGEARTLEAIAKYVPFFGLAGYLMFRPKLPEAGQTQTRL